MFIKLYECNDDRKKLDKSLLNEIEIEGNLTNSISLIDLSFTLKIGSIKNIYSYNYAYIEIFKRYYFIENIEIFHSTFYLIHLKIDVLNTYKNFLLEQNFLILKNKKLNYPSDYEKNNNVIKKKYDFENIFFEGYSDIGILLNG